ncbi:MAG: sensor histidine kinase [Planctomycetaceae bacterium]
MKTIPLTRRIVDNFLLYSLSCLFLCMVLVLLLHWRSQLATHAYLAAIVPSVALIAGAFALRHMFRMTEKVDLQLRELARLPRHESMQLQPLSGNDQFVAGWNSLIDRFTQQNLVSTLEVRLSQSLGKLQNRKYEFVFNMFPQGLAITDEDEKLLNVNRAFPAVLNLEDETQLSGRKLTELLQLEKVPEYSQILEKLKQREFSTSFEIHRREDNVDTFLRIERNALKDQDDAFIGYLWSVRDVTQTKLAEKMRDDFLFTATHELRTPLANIKAYAETLALDDDIDIEQQKQFCNIINAEVTRLSRFVDELLNVSQMEAGALSLSRQDIDLARLLDEVIENVRPQMTQKQIQFSIVIPPKLPEINIDKDKFSAALVNLLGNAAKYTPDNGEIRFTVSQTSHHIQMLIEDNGIGISKDDLPKIFDKFFRSNDDRVRAISGSGLGLSFTNEVVKLHGGTLSVASELHKGTKITLTFPVG